ncbi:glycosyltransferase family 2 protein [Pimelobacter simplex]|uniref:glycosyltransferase family 2 protein n=1 Tax=Nocardioides simplex TaxID=2045 RepID=UPI003670B9F9
MAAVPDVSVVIPVYNTAAYLPACLDSLLGQTIGTDRLEVVAVDDGSTDGSGALLDDYAAAHPGVVRVVHQANSGGPARPCNVGLDHARGRFVFFLGSDDYLAGDGLARMIAAADEWDADVVVPAMVGVNGRNVDQRLFHRDEPDMPFPRSNLPFSLSNTKLFRRALLDEHGIRYALDMRVGSDQPFAISAMLAARRISVLGRPHIYFAVRRDDADNISYTTTWRDRLAAIVSVIEHICAIVPPGDDRDAIIRRHFGWELNKIVMRNIADVAPDERPELLAAVAAVADDYLTPGVERLLKVGTRLRWWHVRRGDIPAVLALGDSAPKVRAHVEDGELFLVLPGFRDGVPDDIFRPTGDNVPNVLQRGLGEQTAELRDGALQVTASSEGIAAGTVGALSVALVAAEGPPAPARLVTGEPAAVVRVPVEVGADGRLHAEADVSEIAAHRGRWAARWQLRVGGDVYDVPVRSALTSSAPVRRRLRTTTVEVRPGLQDRVVVEVRS